LSQPISGWRSPVSIHVIEVEDKIDIDVRSLRSSRTLDHTSRHVAEEETTFAHRASASDLPQPVSASLAYRTDRIIADIVLIPGPIRASQRRIHPHRTHLCRTNSCVTYYGVRTEVDNLQAFTPELAAQHASNGMHFDELEVSSAAGSKRARDEEEERAEPEWTDEEMDVLQSVRFFT
jgi:hypothetical protein